MVLPPSSNGVLGSWNLVRRHEVVVGLGVEKERHEGLEAAVVAFDPEAVEVVTVVVGVVKKECCETMTRRGGVSY